MISKLERVTDECDLMEGRTSGSSVEKQEDEFATCIDDVDDSGKVQECAKSSRLMNFQVEPGHYDFMTLSKPYSKPFSSSTDSSGSTRTTRKDSTTTTTNTIDSSRMISHSTTTTTNNKSAANSFIEARRQQVVNPPATRTVIIQPLLASYTWSEVECMMVEAGNEHLGRGGFGDVFKGKSQNGKFVAVKVLNEGSRQGDTEFLNEVNLLSTVNHRNLVKLLGYCQQGSHRALVYEYAEEGDIYYHIHREGCDLDWRTRLKISLEAATGLEYLHTGCSQMIVHRDIKSNNILLTKNLGAKVADFGLSKMGPIEGNSKTQFDTMVKGTPGYLDPAYSKSGILDESSDIYSFGIVLLELITGRPPFPNSTTPNSSNLVHIKDWVTSQTGGLKLTMDARSDAKLKKISDPKLDGKFNLKSMREVLTLALKCVDEDPTKRPDIRIVIAQLRAAIVHEDNTSHASKWSLRSLMGRTSL